MPNRDLSVIAFLPRALLADIIHVALATGTRLGSYEIVGALGAGGMGVVYRARDTKLNRNVALKVLPDAFVHDPDRLARFKREAQVLASLNHPNIAAIYGFEESDGVQALVLELVEGSTLAERLARPESRALPASSSGGVSGSRGRSSDRPDRARAMPLTEALTIARQIAEALEAAHEQGIVHRDLKPANIKLRPDGTVKVLDFGLAKLVAEVGHDVQDDRSVRLPLGGPRDRLPDLTASPTITTPAMTQIGVILGTAAYMSPEQAKGQAADKRSDIWAFGCVLYEMLTGKRAFEGEDVSDTLAAVLRGEPDWAALPADVPPRIRTLVQRCLEKDRRERIGDVSTALFLIREVRETPATPTQPTVRSLPLWRRAVPVLATAIVAVALGGVVVWRFKPSTPLTVTRFSFTLGDGQQFFNAGRHMLALSPDGTQMVYVANRQLYLRSLSELEARPIPVTQVPQGMTTPVFSPDGRSIAFVTVGILERVGVSGGTPVTIADLGGAVYGMSWADDTILLGLGGKGIARVSANGGTPERIVTVKDDELAHGPQMLPGGRAVLFTLATGTGDDRWDRAKIVVQTLASGERKILIDGGADARYLPTGHVVYARGGILFAMPFDPGRLAVAGESVRIAEGVARAQGTSSTTGAAHFSVSNTGSLIYLPGPTSTASFPRDLALMDRQGVVQTLKLPSGPYESPRFSPDGKRVAVGTDDGRDAIVWIHDLAGTSPTRRLTLEGRNRFPIWSADGQRVAFQSDRERDFGIFWQRADGSGTPERLTRPEQGESHVPNSWSPDGQKFLFSVAKGATFSLWTFSFSDRKAAPFGAVQSAVLPNAVFSPDGRWVAYESSDRTETRGRAVFVQPFPSTGERRQIAAGGMPLWSRDGTQLFFGETTLATDLSVVSITTQPTLTFGNPTHVPRIGRLATRGGPNAPRNWDIAADDQRQIGVVDAELTQPQIRVVLNWLEELKQRVPTR